MRGRTFFDTARDPGGFDVSTRAQVGDVLRFVDVFLPNEAEACALARVQPSAARAAAQHLQKLSGGWIVVKLGARGCVAAGPDRIELEIPAPVVEIVTPPGRATPSMPASSTP